MATSLPALPTDSNSPGPNTGQDAPSPGGGGASPFTGGLPGMMQALQQIEAGYKTLVDSLPSMAPLAADAVSKLRMAVPNALGAAAGQGGQPASGPGQSGPGAASLPAPPTPPMQQG